MTNLGGACGAEKIGHGLIPTVERREKYMNIPVLRFSDVSIAINLTIDKSLDLAMKNIILVAIAGVLGTRVLIEAFWIAIAIMTMLRHLMFGMIMELIM